MMSWLRALALCGVIAACGGRQSTSGITADDAIVKLTANVRDANVYFDGRFIGPVGLLKAGIAVEPGKHRVELRHDDYFSAYVELDLKRAERRTVALTLSPVLP
jgi:hypothetical protein